MTHIYTAVAYLVLLNLAMFVSFGAVVLRNTIGVSVEAALADSDWFGPNGKYPLGDMLAVMLIVTAPFWLIWLGTLVR